MTVYVVTIGEYAEQGLVGVYSTLDKAKAYVGWATKWREFQHPDTGEVDCWTCGEGDTACINRFEVDGA